MTNPVSFSFSVESVASDPADAYGGVIATLRALIETGGRHRLVRLATSLPEHLKAIVPGKIVTITIGDPDGPRERAQG